LLPKKKAVPVVPAGETTSTDPAEERQPGTMPGLRVTLNAAKNGIELHFNGKPSEDILSKVKQNGFRWARGSRVWYANDTPVRRKIVEGWSGVAIGETPKVAEYQLKDNEVQPEGTPYIYRKLADQWAYSHKPSNSEPTWINMNPPLDFRDRLETLLAQKSYVEPVVSVVAKSNINVEVDNSPYEKEKRRKAIDAAWSMATKFINNGQGTDEYYNVFKKDLEVYVRDYYAMKPEDLEAAVKDVGGYAGLFDLWSKQTARAQKPAPITKQLEAEDIAHAKEQERSANEIIKAAANEGVKGAEDALKGLHALFGGSSLKSFPGAVDEATYAAARPHFKSALDHFVKAGKGLKEYMEFLFKQFGNGIKPYALRFLSDVKNNAPELQIDDIIKADAEKGVTVYDERSEHTEDDRDSASGQSAPDVSGVENNGETTGVSGEPQGTAGRDGSGNSQSVEGGKKGHGPTGKRAVSDNGEQVSAGTGNSALSGIPGRDYRIPPGGLKREGSWRVTAERNLDIIKLVRQLDEEGRAATPEEQELLSKYTGFGASEIANKLFPGYSQYGKIMENWADKEWRPLVDKLLALNLSPEELKTLAKSTQYAHYTSEAIVRGIYTALEQRGFRGGKILEPGMGSGNFIGAMPDSIYTSSKYTGIEMDHLTASIAKYLYPQQNILQADYTKQKLPHNFFDLAIGNPPFADTPILSDPEYRKNKFSMHDYFFAKTIDRVRPGGLMVFVTSRYTMDKVDDKARAYLAERADLVGAVRLPQTAFLQHSGTEVVTDILFFRKKVEGSNIEGFAWNELKEIQTPEGPAKINEYYADHPEMILGTSSLKGTMYGANQYTVLPREGNIDEQFAAALENLPGYIYSPASKPAEVVKEAVAERDFNPTLKKEGGVYLNKNGVLMRVEQGAGQQLDNLKKLSKRDREWLTDYVPLRDAVKQAKYDQWQDSGWEKSLQKVNKLYQAFIKKHGRLQEFTSIDKTEQDEDGNDVVKSSRRFKNAALFKIDTEGVVVEALEYIDDDGNIKEAAFLKDRTIRKPEPPQIKTLTDALAVSLDQTGVFDLDHISELAKISRNEVIDGLGDMVYETTAGEWQLADEYLSGDVVRKLEEAEQAARMDDKYKRNVEALTKVQPRPLTNSDISVKLGATWLDHGIIEEFADDVLEVPVSLTYTPATGKWRVDNSAPKKRDGWYYGRRGAPKAARPQGLRGAGGEWSTADRGPNELLESILNNQSIKITRTDSDGKTYTDTDATTAANEVAKNMRKRFSAWVWEDAERANILLDEYNKRYNNMAARRFDGSHLTLPGVSLKYKLHPHQLRAIWRVIQTGDTYLAHAVGAGKTIEMIAAGMEMKRLGMIAKPLYVVPNHMLEQFSSEFQDLYPLAIIMVADEENFHTTNRRRFMAQATMNNPDAIVITHSSFGKMGMKPENVAQVRDEILNELREYLYELQDQEGEKAPKTKQMEKRIEKAEQRFDSIAVSERSDQSMTFEDLGVDFVFVDEAHEFRKLDFSTSRQVKGIDPVGSRKALDLYVKTRWLQGRKPGRSIVFASGTPITNTIGELYTVQRFFQHDQMEEDGINHFDAWSAMFGEIEPGFEMNAAGRYEVIERFSKFDNMPELSKRVRTFMDVLTSDQLSAYVKRPEIKGGQAEIVVVPPSAELKDYQQNTLLPRIERSKKWKPSRDERNNPDPIIAIIADGRLASIDMRFMNPALPSDPDSKLNRMIDGIIESYKEGKGIQYKDRETDKPDPIKGGAQIVFYNQGFGAGVVANRGFDSRAWLMKRLKDAKIPASEVAWIDDYDTADKKEAMMKEVRQGNKRILIGSAKKMGTGMNVQKRLLALHYLDPPWYPADVIQPDGRILRQGNQNDVVTLQRYATKGSYDATQWQMVARKAKAIESFLNGDDSVRSIEDLSESNQFAMAAALASGDERVIQLAGLQADVERLISLQNAHAQEQSSLRWQKTNAETGVKWTKNRVADLKVASKAVGGWIRDFTGKVGDTDYNKRDEFGQALLDAYTKIVDDLLENPPKQSGGYDKDIGTINGFKISLQYHVTKNHQTREQIKAKEEAQYTIDGFSMDLAITKDVAGSVARASYGGVEITDTPRGLTDKIINTLNGVDKELKEREQSLQEEQEQMAVINKRLGTPYQYANELAEKIAEATRLQNELTAEGEQVPDAGTLPAIDFVNDGEETEAQFKLTDSPARGIQAAEAQAWVSTLPISKRVNVVQSVENLPTNARAEITKAQVDPARVQAMELKGTIHVITDNVPDMQRVKALVVGHELAHAGQSEKIVDLAVDWFKRTTEKEGEHIRSAHAILEQVAGRYGYDLTNDKEFRKAVQEATAAIAEQVADGTLKPIGLMTRLFMYLKHWLRQNGLISHVSDSELSLAVAEMLRIGEKRLSVGIGESKKPKYFLENGEDPARWSISSTAPESTVKAYKLFRTLKSRPGELFPLFIGKTDAVPVGTWIEAEHIPTKGYAPRPGWHAGLNPSAPHLRSAGKIAPDRVWAEIEMPADVDWQSVADGNKTASKTRGDIQDQVPTGGHYAFNTSKRGSDGKQNPAWAWMIGGAIKIVKILTNKDVADVLTKSGMESEIPFETQNNIEVFNNLDTVTRFSTDSEITAKFALAPEIKENISRISEAATLNNLKGILNPLDYSRFRDATSDHLPHSANTWLADNIGNPFWVKENNPAAAPFYDEAKDREVTRMDNNIRMYGGLMDKEGNRVGWDKVKGLFDWNDKTTAWGKIRQEMYDKLTDKQKAAYDVIRFEGDAYNKVYAKLGDALRNHRIKSAGLDAATFAFYQAAIAEEAKAFDVKLQIAAENMAEAGMTPEDIEGHISEYRAKYKDIEGWVHRDHGEGEYQVRVYQPVTSLDLETDEVQHKGEVTDRIRVGTFAGVELTNQMENIIERLGGSFKQLRNGAIIILMPKGQGQKALKEFNALELLDKEGKPKYNVLVYNHFISSVAAAKKLTAKVKSNYKAAMPRNYRDGYEYNTSWNFSAKLNEEDYQVLKTSDMKLELILRSAIDKAKAKGEVSAAEAKEIKKELVRSTAEILLGRGAGLYQIRRAQYLIEGYDTDNAVKKYEDYVNGTAGLFSKARYALRQFKNMKDAPASIRAWATKYVGDSLRNMGSADMVSGNARAIVSLWYLGFNTSWMLVNSTQPLVVGQAELSKYTSSPAFKIAKAEKDILTSKLTDEEKSLFTDMQVRSQDHDSMMAEMTGSNEGIGGKASKMLHGATKIAMALGQKVEVLNRHTMIVSAYRVFKGEKGMDHATALKQALDVNSMVNIDMGRYNLPAWARGPVGRTFYALQSYIQHMLNYLYNRSTSGNRADQKAVLRLLFAMFLLGGLPAGAPGSDELDKLIQTIFGYSPKLAFKSWMHRFAKDYDTPGEMLEGFVWHGIPGAFKPFGIGVSLTGATQFRLPIISSVIGGDDMYKAVGGPVSGLFTKGKMSIQAAVRGDWGRAVEYILPTAPSNIMSAIRQSTDGVKIAAGKRVEYKGKQLKMEPQEAALKAFGLQPARTADISETRGFEKSTQAEWNDRRKDALDNYRMSRKLKYIQEFNRDLRGSQAQGLVPAISPESLANVWGKTNVKKSAWERAHGVE
jgi:N12 class adenine-specific DNA methylase